MADYPVDARIAEAERGARRGTAYASAMDAVAPMQDPTPVAPVDGALHGLAKAHDELDKQLSMLTEAIGPVMADPSPISENTQVSVPQRHPDSIVGRRIQDEVSRAQLFAERIAMLRSRLEI